MTKECSKCKQTCLKTMFYADKRRKDQCDSQCKECRRNIKRLNKEYHDKYRADNKEKILEAQRKRYKDKHFKKVKEYQEKNKEQIAERRRVYHKTPEGRAKAINRFILRKKRIGSNAVPIHELKTLIESSKHCYYCKCDLSMTKYEIDHYIPLALGGEHSIENLVVACRSCNRSKWAKHPEEFIKLLDMRVKG